MHVLDQRIHSCVALARRDTASPDLRGRVIESQRESRSSKRHFALHAILQSWKLYQTGGFAATKPNGRCAPYAETVDFDGLPIRTVNLQGLLRTKQSMRDKDVADRVIRPLTHSRINHCNESVRLLL